jgi:hypothetical protein
LEFGSIAHLAPPIPSCFNRNNMIPWTWDGIAEMIEKVEHYWDNLD